MWWLPLSIWAHVAPSPDADNRYVKITLLPGQARIAYTLFLGERPGAMARARMDTNQDGLLSDDEARTFGLALRDEIVPRVALSLDGAIPDATWTLADVGLGTPTTSAGAFSVDLVTTLPYPPGRAEHTFTLSDTFRPPKTGEAELRIEAAPDVTLLAAHRLGASRGVQTLYSDPRGGPQEVSLTFRAPIVAPPKTPPPRWPYWLGGAVLILLAVVVRLRGPRPPKPPP